MPELDRYEDEGMDNAEFDAMGVDQRRAAERELDQDQHARDMGQVRAPAAFVDDEELSGDEQFAERRGQARMMRGAEEVDDEGGLGNMANVNDYGEAKGPLTEWPC